MQQRAGRSVRARPGVALLTAGPGVTDGVTGVANAYLAGSPILVIGGAAPLGLWDRGALQEMNQIDLLRPSPNGRVRYTRQRAWPSTPPSAFRQMLNGKPGPTFLEMPMDVLNNFVETEAYFDPGEPSNYRPAGHTTPEAEYVLQATAILEQAQRPVIMAGTTVWWCNAAEPLRRLAERIQAPVFLNGAGRGCLPPTHPLFFSTARRKALEGADTILAIGTRMDFRLNHGQPPLIPAGAKLIWLDLAGEDIGANRGAAAGLAGDVGISMSQLAEATKQHDEGEWLRYIRTEERRALERDAAALNSSCCSYPSHAPVPRDT